jgi:large subunit ribosomal protein L17
MKRLKPIADKMVTLAKKGTMHHRRQVAAYLRDEDVVRKIFNEYPKRYASRQGGYTTAVRIGERKGDGAPMCFFMMVDSPLTHDVWKEVKDNAVPLHQAPLKQKQ